MHKSIDEIRRDNIALILKELETKGVTARRFAEDHLKISEGQFGQWKNGSLANGKPRGMRPQSARKIEAAAGKATGWLDQDHSSTPMPDQVRESNDGDVVAAYLRPSDFRRVPVIGKAQGGLPERIWDNDGAFEATWDEYADVATADPRAFLSRVVGVSMYPRFRPGELALIEPGTEPAAEDDVLVRLTTGETMLKHLLWAGEKIRLGSYNDPGTLEFHRADVQWMYYAAHPVAARKLKYRT